MTEWISFEDAGRLVDGPAGWTRSEDGSRLHAQALFAMAKKGLVAVTATNWLCRYNGDDETIATDRDKPELLLALEAREKLGSDVFTALLAPAMKRVYIFSLFDEASGNYQVTGVTKISYDSGDQDRYPSGHFVNGLRFNRAGRCECLCIEPASHQHEAGERLTQPQNGSRCGDRHGSAMASG